MVTQIGMPLVIALPPAKCLKLSAQPALTRVGPDADIANWADLFAEKRLNGKDHPIPSLADSLNAVAVLGFGASVRGVWLG